MMSPDRMEVNTGVPLGEPVLPQDGIKTVEEEFPKDLDGRMNAILTSFNIAPKTVTLLLLGSEPITPDAFHTKFFQVHRESEINNFYPKSNHAKTYVTHSLGPIGLVAQQIKTRGRDGRETLLGVSLTEAGVKYGQPAAAAFLEFEKKSGFSLYPVFGKTGKSSEAETRAPLNRAKVLLALKDGAKSISELEDATGLLISVIGHSVKGLSKKGSEAIEGKRFNQNTGENPITYTRTKLPREEVEQFLSSPTLTNAVADACEVLKDKKVAITLDNILKQLDKSIGDESKRNNRRVTVGAILIDLKKQDFLTGGEHSTFQLTEKGQKIVNELLIPLENAMQDGPTLQTWTDKVLPRVKQDLALYAKVAGDNYYPYSISKKMTDHSSFINKVFVGMQELTQKNTLLTTSNIMQKTGITDYTLTERYLPELIRSGRVEVADIKGNNTKVYRLVNNEVQPQELHEGVSVDLSAVEMQEDDSIRLELAADMGDGNEYSPEGEDGDEMEEDLDYEDSPFTF